MHLPSKPPHTYLRAVFFMSRTFIGIIKETSGDRLQELFVQPFAEGTKMPEKESFLEYFAEIEDEETPSLVNRGVLETETIDLKEMIRELETPMASPGSRGFETTSFGKLMESLPIPALLLDRSHAITFANQAWERISPEYRNIRGRQFGSLFPDSGAAGQVKSLVERVFNTRITQIIEAVVKIDGRKIWGRAHLRSLRWGPEAAILALIEDLTLEKSQLVLHKRLRKELEKRVEERTRELERANRTLQEQVSERSRIEEELRRSRQRLEEVVVERTAELNETVRRLKLEVTERKKMEQALRSSKQHLDVAFRANPAAVFLFSLKDGRYVEVNDTFCKVTGYDRDDVIGRTAETLKHWARLEYRDQMIRALLENGEVRDFEAVFRAKDGRMLVGSFSAEKVDLDGEDHVLCTMVDVTERKRAERDHQRLTAAVEQVKESIVITDSSGHVRYVNPAFAALSGFSREEINGRNVNLIRCPKANGPLLVEAYLAMSEARSWTGRLTNQRKDGSFYEVDTTISPIRSPKGNVVNFVMVERVASPQTGPATTDAVRMAGAATDYLGEAAGIAENLVTGMLGYAFLARDKIPQGGPACRDLDQALIIGKRSREILGQVTTFAGQSLQTPTKVDMRTFLQSAAVEVRSSFPPDVDIVVRCGAEVGSVTAVPGQLMQLVKGLCHCAYSATSQPPALVSIEADVTDPLLSSLEAADGGTASGPHLRIAVTAREDGRQSGTRREIPDFRSVSPDLPFGMALARAVAGCLGGWISVSGERGPSPTLEVYLPIPTEGDCKDQTGDETTTALNGSLDGD